MIYQGDNHPIVVTFSEEITGYSQIFAGLYHNGATLKHWEKSDMQIGSKTAVLPLTQQDTLKMPCGRHDFEIKALDSDGITQFYEIAHITVAKRNDKTAM